MATLGGLDAVDWNLYRSFLAVLREGSLSAAARALQITQPTVGRHIAELEEALGVTLFTRTQHGYRPTALAETLRAPAEAAAHSMSAMQRLAANRTDAVAGVVRVTAGQSLSLEALPPLLSPLLQQHPELRLEIDVDNALHDVLQRQSDIAVRLTAPRQTGLVAQRVGQMPLGLYAHHAYLHQAGEPRSIHELQAHRMIGVLQVSPWVRTLLSVSREQANAWPSLQSLCVRSDSDAAQLAMMRAGAGIGICAVAVGERDAGLRRVLPKGFAPSMPLWLAMHEDLRQLPAHVTVFRHLAQGLARWLEGPPTP